MRDAELLLAASGLAVSKMHFLIIQNCSQFKKGMFFALKNQFLMWSLIIVSLKITFM